MFLNSQVADFTAIPSYEFGDASDDTRHVAIGDVNNDDIPDIIEANGRGATKLYYGNAYTRDTGDFGHVPHVLVPFLPGNHSATSEPQPNTAHVAIADMDNDGYNDIIIHNTAREGDCSVRCRQNGRFGFNNFAVRLKSYDTDRKSLCYCGPSIVSFKQSNLHV